MREKERIAQKSRQDFDRAKSKAFFRKLIHNIFQRDNQLFQFDEVKHILAPHGMAFRGIKSIPIDKIVGSEGRYQDFDSRFLPNQDHTRRRWENINSARMEYVELPPISVYKLGNNYFVKDGNHRVSVARGLGQEFIDAEVTELFTDLEIPDTKLDSKSLLVADSYRFFLRETRITEYIPEAKIKLTNPWGYYRLLEHINTYKYLLSERDCYDVPWHEAVQRWYWDLFYYVTDHIRRSELIRHFPERTEGDLYIWVMDHWHYLKQKYGQVELEHAIDDYTKEYGKKPFRKLWKKFKKWLERLLIGS